VIIVCFDLDINLDVAEREVRAAVNAAKNLLPADLSQPPIYVIVGIIGIILLIGYRLRTQSDDRPCVGRAAAAMAQARTKWSFKLAGCVCDPYSFAADIGDTNDDLGGDVWRPATGRWHGCWLRVGPEQKRIIHEEKADRYRGDRTREFAACLASSA
jgi:hypothetical protein